MRIKELKEFDKVEMYWGDVHDVINTKTRRCIATFWTKDAARKEVEYFSEYVGLDLDALDFHRGRVHATRAKDGVLDVIVNVKKPVVSIVEPFNRRIFDRVLSRSFDVVASLSY